MPDESTPTEAVPVPEGDPNEGLLASAEPVAGDAPPDAAPAPAAAVPPLPPGARIVRQGTGPRGAPVNPDVKAALRNQSRNRTVRQITVTAVAELRGDGEEGGPLREAVTLWSPAGKKIGDFDNTTLDALFPGV
jgi:hypothetical protein